MRSLSCRPVSRFGCRQREFAFSLIELLVAIGIILLLFACSIPIADSFQKASKKAKCLSNMRNIHGGLSTFVADKGHWPQMEEEKFDFTDDEFYKFWILSLEPYGVAPEAWICPADRSLLHLSKESAGEYYGSYVVTRFDRNPATPFRWSQPWLMERGDFHGKGSHIMMPDGSIEDSQNPFHSR